MKLLITGLLLGLALFLAGPADGTEEMYELVAISVDVREAMKEDGTWMACGDYFAAAESTEGKIVYFNFKTKLQDKSPTAYAFMMMDWVEISINDKVSDPMIIIETSWTRRSQS